MPPAKLVAFDKARQGPRCGLVFDGAERNGTVVKNTAVSTPLRRAS